MGWRDTLWAFSFALLASLALAFDGKPQGTASPRVSRPGPARPRLRAP